MLPSLQNTQDDGSVIWLDTLLFHITFIINRSKYEYRQLGECFDDQIYTNNHDSEVRLLTKIFWSTNNSFNTNTL